MSVHLWGFISGQGKDLIFLKPKETFNSRTYIKILRFEKKEMDRLGVDFFDGGWF